MYNEPCIANVTVMYKFNVCVLRHKIQSIIYIFKDNFLYKHEQIFNFTLQILSTYTSQFIIKDFILFQVLAKKMTVLYKLAREQLSKQSHYDFGLRALKSVLVMAGELKRGSPDLSEVETPEPFSCLIFHTMSSDLHMDVIVICDPAGIV